MDGIFRKLKVWDIFCLAGISYLLYTALWIIVDREVWFMGVSVPFAYLLVDFGIACLFTGCSLCLCLLTFSILPSKTSYLWTALRVGILFLLNNLIAYLTALVSYRIFPEIDTELFSIKGIYIYGMLATFVSCIYALQSYIQLRNERQRLEMDLMKEKEAALQVQLQSLKLQINPHFMFNNFSILSELIEEDKELAETFLAHLSKVYRYVLSHLDKDLVPLAEEICFLQSYLYLIKLRYQDSILANIDVSNAEVGQCLIPPMSLQFLVENAVKHNTFSKASPLRIDILVSDGYVIVRNNKSPLLSPPENSTHVGQKNIRERYALLCDKEVKIADCKESYTVSLPLIHKPYGHPDLGR